MRFVKVNHGFHTDVMHEIVEIVVRVDKAITRFEFEIIDAYIVGVIGIKCTTGVMDTVLFSIDLEFI